MAHSGLLLAAKWMVLAAAMTSAAAAPKQGGLPTSQAPPPLRGDDLRGADADTLKGILDDLIEEQKSKGEEPDDSLDLHAGGAFLGRGKLTCLSCEDDGCDEEHLLGTCSNAIRCYSGQVRDVDGTERRSRGCARDFQTQAFYCRSTDYDGRHAHQNYGASAQYAFKCCAEDRCNGDPEFPQLPPVPLQKDEKGDEEGSDPSPALAPKTLMFILIPIALVLLLGAPVLCCIRKAHRRRMAKLQKDTLAAVAAGNGHATAMDPLLLGAQAAGDSTMREFLQDANGGFGEMTSGSGSGMARLQNRTLAKRITLPDRNPLSNGRYGQVWRGLLEGREVAVKIFNTKEEESFKRETEVYSRPLVNGNSNILICLGHDVASLADSVRMWLVTDYHQRGSLYDHLNSEGVEIGPTDALRLLSSVARGLDYLHHEVRTATGTSKPAIAHRDIKSKNILVTDDGRSCVLADFGLAVIQEVPSANCICYSNNIIINKFVLYFFP